MSKVKTINYFDGEWSKIPVDIIDSWFSCDIDWDSIEDVREHGEKYLEVNKKNGYTYYYENVFGHYAKPVRFR